MRPHVEKCGIYKLCEWQSINSVTSDVKYYLVIEHAY